MKKYKLIKIILIALIIMINFNFVYASQISSGQIDFVTIKHNNNLIKIDIDNYLAAKYSGNKDLLYFLSDGTGYLDVYSIISGYKHILLEQYLAKLYYDLNNNPKKYRINAINNAKTLEHSEYKDEIIDFSKINYKLTELELGIFKAKILGGNASIIIPYSKVDNSIKTFKISFSQPVKILKVNGKTLNDEAMSLVLDKFIRSGYEPDSFYSNYSFTFNDTYKYSMIYDLSKSITFTVQNESGYTKDIRMSLSIEK